MADVFGRSYFSDTSHLRIDRNTVNNLKRKGQVQRMQLILLRSDIVATRVLNNT